MYRSWKTGINPTGIFIYRFLIVSRDYCADAATTALMRLFLCLISTQIVFSFTLYLTQTRLPADLREDITHFGVIFGRVNRPRTMPSNPHPPVSTELQPKLHFALIYRP